MEGNEPAALYLPRQNMSPAEYIEWESTQKEKHEYIGGLIYNMAGASIRHNKIFTNLMRSITPHLSGETCEIYGSDLKVLVKSKDAFFYPDATIVCGEIELADEFTDTVKNPAVVFEILSPSTASHDLGKKFFMYLQIESLKEIFIIDTTTMEIRSGKKTEANSWFFSDYHLPEEIFTIETIQLSLTVKQVYDQVKWE